MAARLPHLSMATRLHSFKFLHHYSTAALQPQPLSVLQNYLINSIGLTPEAASTATKNQRLYKSFDNDPDLVVNYFKSFGLNNDHIKSMVSAYPKVLTYNVSKTLEPKIRVLQGIGLSESDIAKIVRVYKSLFVKGVEPLVERIQFLKDLLGSSEKVAKAVSKCAVLLFDESQKNMESGISALREIGFSDRHIAHFLMHCPLLLMRCETQWFQDVLHRVEHDLGIPRDSGKFFYAVKFVSSLSKSSMEDKLGVFRRFGWSDETIRKMVGNFPTVLGTSEDKLTKCLAFFMGEVGCSPELLASNGVAFCLCLEKVKLRNDVLKVLDEKKLNQRKKSHFAVLVSTDQTFLKHYLLPHHNEIPELYESYIEKFHPAMKGGNEDAPLDIAKIFCATQQKNGKFIETREEEKYDEIIKIVQANTSLSPIDVVETCFGGGTKRKHFKDPQVSQIKELMAKLQKKDEENNDLKRRVEEIENLLIKMRK